MSFRCPWCGEVIDRDVVAGLTRIAKPAPCCGKPISQSIWQVIFTVLMLLPLIAIALFVSRIVYDAGSKTGSVLVLLIGIAIGVYAQKFVPLVHGPGRGFGSRDK